MLAGEPVHQAGVDGLHDRAVYRGSVADRRPRIRYGAGNLAPRTPLDVGIIGCGFAGAAAATLLARAGHRVRVYERVAEPGAVGAGILLQPTGLAVLAQLGLLAPLLARLGLEGQMLRTLCGVKRGLLRPSLPLAPLSGPTEPALSAAPAAPAAWSPP